MYMKSPMWWVYLVCCPRAFWTNATTDLLDVMSSGRQPSRDRQFKSTYDKLYISEYTVLLCLTLAISVIILNYYLHLNFP